MSIKIINKLKVHGEDTTQKYTDSQYSSSTLRKEGAQPGTPVSSKLVNTGLRQATLVTTAFVEALKVVVPNSNDLTSNITIGVDTTLASLTTSFIEALAKIKVEHATLADNVKSGAIVETTEYARQAEQGFEIDEALHEKLNFKGVWSGTHKNNDVLYYSVGRDKGYYVVKGLSTVSPDNLAGTITITGVNTPTSQAANLSRLTFETAIGTDTALSKTSVIASNSTEAQLPSAAAVYTHVNTKQDKIPGTSVTKTKILTKSPATGMLDELDKVTSVDDSSTDNQIPTAKLLRTLTKNLDSNKQDKIPAGSELDIMTRTDQSGTTSTLTKVTSIGEVASDIKIPTEKAVKTYADSKQSKIPAGTGLVTRTSSAGVTGTMNVSSNINAAANNDIPTMGALKAAVNTLNSGTGSWKLLGGYSSSPNTSAYTQPLDSGTNWNIHKEDWDLIAVSVYANLDEYELVEVFYIRPGKDTTKRFYDVMSDSYALKFFYRESSASVIYFNAGDLTILQLEYSIRGVIKRGDYL